MLLPVEVFEIAEWAVDARAVKVRTLGDDYFKLYPEDVEVLIPANRLTDLEAENARLRAFLSKIFDAQVKGGPLAVAAIINRAIDQNNTGDNQ